MYPLKQLKRIRKDLHFRRKYIHFNPNLTASQYGRLWGEPYGTTNTALYKLCKEGRLFRFKSHSAGGTPNTTWRYTMVKPIVKVEEPLTP